MTYKEKLLDPRWQKKRLLILQRDNFACQKCESTTETLHVHHRRYIPKHDPWDYKDDDLVTLCAECHEEETAGWQEEMGVLEDTLRMCGYFCADVRELTIYIYNNWIHGDEKLSTPNQRIND